MRRLPERRPARSLAAALALAVGLAAGGCGATHERREIRIDEHAASLEAPPGWRHLDHGREQLFRRGDAQVALVDLGPMGRAGIRRQVERALALGLERRLRDAAARLGRVPVPDELFEQGVEQRREFWEAWSAATSNDIAADTAAVRAAFDRLLGEVARLPDRDLEACVAPALRELGEDPRRRDVAATRHVTVSGREALAVDTWTRLSHQDRRSFGLVFDDGCLIALRTDRGAPVGTRRAFETLMSSLEFVATPAADSAAASGAAVSGR